LIKRQKASNIFAISVFIFVMLCSSLIRVTSVKAEESSFFSEHFDGPAIDTSKWNVQEQNVNLSGNPAWRGNVTVKNSCLYMSSNGSAFPYIQTVDNPFPKSGDFILQFSMQYTTIADWGDGLMLGNGTPTLDQTGWHNKIFDVWAADKGTVFDPQTRQAVSNNQTNIYIELLDKAVYEMDYSGFKPTSPVQIYELAYINGVYHVYVNGSEVAQAQSDVRPTTIIIGEPPIFDLPQSPENMAAWGYWGWSNFQMDYINIQQQLDSVGKTTPSIAASCQTVTTASNFKVEITGTLTASGAGISNVPILLSYSVNEGKSWIELTTAGTDNSGNFAAVWFPTVSGIYLLNTLWTGNSTFSDVNATINFAVLPYQEQSVFSVSSNSTISAFSFNSTSQELSFSVNGTSGTTGYVDVYIPKSLIGDISDLRVLLDGNQVAYTTQSQGDSWLVSFSYHHSTHQVSIALTQAGSQNAFLDLNMVQIAILVLMSVISVVVVVYAFVFLTKKRSVK
jgi:hypothetical protein